MIYGSICSGIEAASVAWAPLGWRAAFLSEVDPFARAVLRQRCPAVPLHGDFTTIQAGDYEPIELLVGGTPCQDFSVAGLRAGLAGERGGLTIEFVRLAGRLRPRWLVWENVPGVLSIDGGRAFGAFLGGLGQCGYGVAYRVLDAQHFGVPQRRRRVFVIGYLGDWRPAAAVLFEPESLRGDNPPRREAGQNAPTIPSRSTAGGGLGTDFDCDGGLISGDVKPASFGISPDCFDRSGEGAAGTATERSGLGVDYELAYAIRAKRPGGVAFDGNITGPLTACGGTERKHGHGWGQQELQSGFAVVHFRDGDAGSIPEHSTPLAYGGNRQSGPIDVATAVRAKGGTGHGDFESETFITHSLRADGFDASEDGTGRGTPLVATGYRTSPNCGAWETGDRTDALTQQSDPTSQLIAFSSKDHGADCGDTAPTLRAMNFAGSHANAGGQIAVALNLRGREGGSQFEADDLAALRASSGGSSRSYVQTAVAFQERGRPNGRSTESQEDLAYSLTAPSGGGRRQEMNVASRMSVRRLTPRECERLQGFPDDFTAVTYRGKPAADGPRYRALGNSMAVPCMAWIGQRIDEVLGLIDRDPSSKGGTILK